MLELIQNPWLFSAGVAAGLSALLHLFAGGPQIAGPLLRSKDIHDVPKFVNYYCWHLVSITLVAMCVGFLWPAFDPSQTGLAMMWTVVAVAFCLWSIGLVIWKRQNPWYMPQWLLFAVVSVPAIIGLLL